MQVESKLICAHVIGCIVNTHAYTHARTHTRTHAHTHAHTHTHACTHTHITYVVNINHHDHDGTLLTLTNFSAESVSSRLPKFSYSLSRFAKFSMLKDIILSCTPEHSNTAKKVKIAASKTFGMIPISTLQRVMLPICQIAGVTLDL